jgi:hypothetical protein
MNYFGIPVICLRKNESKNLHEHPKIKIEAGASIESSPFIADGLYVMIIFGKKNA